MDTQEPEKYLCLARKIVKEYLPTSKIYLFGSFARGEARASSDIDIAVDLGTEQPTRPLYLLREALEEAPLPYRVDLVDMREVGENLKKRILAEGIRWDD